MSDHLVIHDPRFLHLTLPIAGLQKLAGGMLWAEGPAWLAQSQTLVWSDIPNNRRFQWAEGMGVRVLDPMANNCNGHTVDAQGRLIACEHLTRRVTRREHDGSLTVIADRHGGKRLNSPNDVVVASDGAIWFTDPPYGILCDYEGKTAPQEQPGAYVYRVAAPEAAPEAARGAEPEPVATDFDKPNGLAFSRDERRLFVSDTGLSHDPNGAHHIRVFDVAGTQLSGGAVFAEIEHGVSDGFRIDVQDNLWTSTGRGVSCYAPDGTLLGEILVPEAVANVCFGGPKRNRLFITASSSLYAIYLAVTG